jgi:hypothetical protein
MIYVTNPVILPFIVLIWSADAWLWLGSTRLVLGKILSSDNPVLNALERLTDPLPKLVKRSLSKWTNTQLPHWLPWLIVFVGAIVFRQMLLQLIFAMQVRR